MAIYQETIIRMKLENPIKFYGGVHHNIEEQIDTIHIAIGRQTDGFYLMASASNNKEATDYSIYMNMKNLEIKIAPWHRMANVKIRKYLTDEKIKIKAKALVQKVFERIAEYKEPRNDNY